MKVKTALLLWWCMASVLPLWNKSKKMPKKILWKDAAAVNAECKSFNRIHKACMGNVCESSIRFDVQHQLPIKMAGAHKNVFGCIHRSEERERAWEAPSHTPAGTLWINCRGWSRIYDVIQTTINAQGLAFVFISCTPSWVKLFLANRCERHVNLKCVCVCVCSYLVMLVS